MRKNHPSVQEKINQKQKMLIDFLQEIHASSLQPISDPIEAMKNKIDGTQEKIEKLITNIENLHAHTYTTSKTTEKTLNKTETSIQNINETLNSRIPEGVLQQLHDRQQRFETMLGEHKEDIHAACATLCSAVIATLSAQTRATMGLANQLRASKTATHAMLGQQQSKLELQASQLYASQEAIHATLTQQQSKLELELKQCQSWLKYQTIGLTVFCIGIPAYLIWMGLA